MSAQSFMLEHFFRGQLVREGTPDGEPRLLAGSIGVRPEQVAEAVQLALLPPLTNAPTGAVALVRGSSGIYYWVQAQVGSVGQYITHVILLPSELIRTLSGNLRALATLIQPSLPTFEKAGQNLPQLPFLSAEPPGMEQQANAMLSLMSATRDRIATIDTLLAAVITGAPLFIQGAPPELESRLTFVEGLQMLLPPPARAGVTFATHAAPQRRPDALITFLPDGPVPEDSVVYTWKQPAPTGAVVSDEYARFIASQLRLDTSLVIEQTTALTPVAGWRIRLGDSLGDALRYASKRLKIDHAVQNNQPVEIDEVLQILTDDPTLSEPLRLAYIEHLLKLALPMNAVDSLRQLGRLVRGNSELESGLMAQIDERLTTGTHNAVIYRAMTDWISPAGGFGGLMWTEQARRAARQHAADLAADQDPIGLTNFLREIANAPSSTHLGDVLPELIEKSMPLAHSHPALAQTVIILAAAVYPMDRFLRLFENPELLSKLPAAVNELLPHLRRKGREPRFGLLAEAAESLGSDARELIAIRFAEIAVTEGYAALVDERALALLAEAADTRWGETYDQTLRWIIRSLSNEEIIASFGQDGARSMLRVLLARHAYGEFATALNVVLKTLAWEAPPGEPVQLDFARDFFATTPLSHAEAAAALQSLAPSGMALMPLVHAYYGGLQAHQWSPAMAESASDLYRLILANRDLVAQIPSLLMLNLMKFFISRDETPLAMRLAALLPEVAAREGEAGAQTMLRMCSLMRDSDTTRDTALQHVRRFIRLVPSGEDRRAAARLAEKLGATARSAFDVTMLFKRIFDGLSIEEYAPLLHITAEFLHDTAMTYVDRERIPGIKVLQGDLDSLNGAFTDDDRRALAREILDLGRGIVAIAGRQRLLRPRTTDAQTEALIGGTLDATAPLDILRIAGGYFSRGKRLDYKLEHAASPHPLTSRPALDVLQHSQIALRVLRSFARAFPAEGRWAYSADALRDELESIWEHVPLHERRQIVEDLALDFQRLPELILFIAEQGNTKALQEDDRTGRRLDLGEKKPENTLELYRLISGYFRLRAR